MPGVFRKLKSLIDFYIFIKVFYKDELVEHQNTVKQKIKDLGIVFIKLAQWYSSFSSLYTTNKPNFIKICQSFQTQVLIQEESRDWIMEPYIQKTIDLQTLEYLASGSIGRVYKAKTLNHKEIVIKVRHANVEEDFKIWCSLLNMCYSFIQPFIHCDASDVLEMLHSQFDFRIEAQNLDLFSEFYKKESSVLKIPKVYYCQENILVTEFIGSYKNDDDLPLMFPEKVEKLCLLKCWIMDQIVLKHCVHGDLHNGNWGITLDKQSLVLYDFGYIFNIPDLSTQFVVSLLKKDSTDVSEKVLELFSIPKKVVYQESIQKLLQDYQKNKKFTFHFIIELLQILYQENLVVFNKKVAFLLNLVMCLNHIHQIEFLQNSEESMEYNYLTLQRFNVLQEYREEIVYNLFLKN